MQVILKNAFKRYYSTGSLIGAKSKCSDMILKLKSIGVDEIACLVDFGVEESKVLEGLKHLKTLKNLFAGRNAGKHKPVTMMQSTPSFIKIAAEGTGSGEFLKSLRLLLLGGEALPVTLVNKLNNEIDADIYNMYGPTETTVWSCMHKLQQQPEKISVGKPIANTQIYILDKNKQLVPIGVTGGLYIGGKGLAKGYWNRETLTKERFINNPFLPEERIYNTGDLARWNEDGTIELIGREDKQVKIRGHRIELGEIEAALSAYESIQESAVICSRQDDDQYLVAYYISNSKIQAADLRKFLSGRLPDYMIPAYYMQLEKMPLTLNGKLDRKSLPDPKRIAVEDYVAPSNDMQVKAVEIWSSVLKMDKEMISIDKSFFEMGGNSLNAAAMINKMNQCFDIKIPLNEVFNRLTIERLVDYIITVKQTEAATAIDINNSIELSI
jgi:acyl-CoA synthetase (AMP-forming)/AMP-acid ligase II/acyl carrier protein